MPVIYKKGGPWSLFCTDCKVWTPNTANAEMRKEGFFASWHVCGVVQQDEVRDADYQQSLREKSLGSDVLQRLAAFLSQYSRNKCGGVIPPEPAYVKSAIRLLIDEEVMTAEEIRQEALEEFGVIVPAELLPARSYAK